MRVRFWGVRGSVPWATPAAIGHGCNTPCVEVFDEASGERLVLDAGSGIVGLGETLTAAPAPIPILLSHYHWDHLQGLPFFAPLYRRDWPLTILAPALESYEAGWMESIFRSPFFPVPFERLPRPPAVRIIDAGHVGIGCFDVQSIRLNHPGGALAYRIRGANATGADLVYASDHELGVPDVDGPLAAFIAGAGAVIFDAHFTQEEEAAHRGWGHSTWEGAVRFCAEAGVGRLWLFHHKPGRTDLELTDIEAQARQILPATDAAGEGDVFEV